MARESVHAKLERVRPPRVHVTYNVEIGDAMELKEIPDEDRNAGLILQSTWNL